jgi:hypothetical protein
VDAIDVRKEAMQAGFAPGGIRRSEIANAGIRGQVAGMEQAATERAKQSRILQMQADENMRNAGGTAGTTGTTGPTFEELTRTPTGSFQAVGNVGPNNENLDAVTDSEMKYGPKGRDIVEPPAATAPAAPSRPATPATGPRINRLTGREFGYTPAPVEMTGPPAPPPTEKTAAQKYAEAQEAYQRGELDPADFAEMNRIYSGADSQGQADIVAQSLKRAAGLEKTTKPAPTKRTSRINLRK